MLTSSAMFLFLTKLLCIMLIRNRLLLFVFRPATATAPAIIKLIDAGMSLARFNMSHGTAKVSQLE